MSDYMAKEEAKQQRQRERARLQADGNMCGAKSRSGRVCNRLFRHRGEHRDEGPDTTAHAGIFGQFVRTAINVALLPIAIVADATTAGGVMSDHNDQGRADNTFTAKRIQKLKDEASE